jgi:signal transduction histidine kinase
MHYFCIFTPARVSCAWPDGIAEGAPLTELVLFRTLRGRLMLVAALATLPAFLFVIYLASKERAAALVRAETDARYVASLAAREHADQVAGAMRLLEWIASGAAAAGDENELRPLLPAVLSGFPQIANIGVISTTGHVRYSVVPAPLPVAMTDNPAFRDALRTDGVAVGRYQMGPIVGRPVLIVARAVRDAARSVHSVPENHRAAGVRFVPENHRAPDVRFVPENRRAQGARFVRENRREHGVRFVLFAALELAWLDDLARQAKLPPRHALLIVDRDGAVLAGSAREGRPLKLTAFRDMMGPEGLSRYTDGSGVTQLGVAAPLPAARDLWVVVGLPEAGVYRAANEVFYRDAGVLALLALLALGCAVLATDMTLLRDLRLLAHATRRFGEGDLSARVALPRSRGEIRDLMRAFNRMADALEAGHRDAMSVQQQLRALTHRLLNAREAEAARIAQELHDGLGQELAVLRLDREHVRRKALAAATPQAGPLASLVDEAGCRVDDIAQSVRRISSELRPGVLDRLGLVSGLQWLMQEMKRRSGLDIELAVAGVTGPVPADIATALFRITQEALTNIVRHAHATRVRASLAMRDGMLELAIADDGAGFDPAARKNGPSLGLIGMRERAARVGGALAVTSAPGVGTRVTERKPQASLQEDGSRMAEADAYPAR